MFLYIEILLNFVKSYLIRDKPVSRWYLDDLACAPSDPAFAALKLLKTNEIEQSVQDANWYH
jgi:hypothetical protein